MQSNDSLRYGLASILVWIGVMKFTSYEADAIQGLVANSPLMGWIYSQLSVQAAALPIGSSEIVSAALSVVAGQFLVKDVVLLGTALWLTGEAWEAAGERRVNA